MSNSTELRDVFVHPSKVFYHRFKLVHMPSQHLFVTCAFSVQGLEFMGAHLAEFLKSMCQNLDKSMLSIDI